MGAKVQCNNYLQFFDSNKDVWEDIKIKNNFGNAWPDYGTGMMLKTSHSCSIFKQETMEKCSEYDKEILKQTMLKHEKIFRSQVRELHRLYEVQKSLMDDLRRKGFTSPAFSSTRKSGELFHFGPEQQTSKDKQNLWDFLDASVREKDERCRSHPTLATDNMQTPGSGLVDHNTLIVLNSKEINGGFKDFNRLQPIRATPRRFDLEQPADEYVDDEAVDELREGPLLRREILGNGHESNFFKFQSDVELESEVQLTLSTGWEKSKKKDDRPNGTLLDMSFHNKEREEAKEAKQSRFNEDTGLFPAASSRADAHAQEDLEKKSSVMPSQSYLGVPWGLVQDYQRHEDRRAEWKKVAIEPEKSKEKSKFLDIEAGERSTQENPKEPHWIFQVRKKRCWSNHLLLAGPGFVNSNTLKQRLIWQNPLATYQARQPEADGVDRMLLGKNNAQSITFQEQRGIGNCWSNPTQQSNFISIIDSSIGSSVGISPSPMLRSHNAISQQDTENSEGGILPSALWRKNEDALSQLPLDVQSKVNPLLSAAAVLQMQNLDLRSCSYGQESICNSTNGMNVIGEVSGFCRHKWYTNYNQVNCSWNQFTFSSVGQDLSQLVTADTPSSIHQQAGSLASPASTPCLSGSLLRGLEESSRALKSPHINELPHWLISGRQNAGKGSQISCHTDLSIASTVDLTLGPSNHAIKNPIYDASDHFNIKSQADSSCKENNENISRTIQDTCQGSVYTNGRNTERSACFTMGLELSAGAQDCESNPVEMISPIKNMGISDLVGKHLSTLKGVTHMSGSHSADKFIDKVVPFSCKDNLNVSLACDSICKDNCILDENNVVKHGEIQARDRVTKPGTLDNQDFDEQLLASTGHNSAQKLVHLHATACLTGHDIQMITSKERMVSGQHDNISNTNGAESRFSCSDTKQLGEAGFQFIPSNLCQQPQIEVPLGMHFNEKTAQFLEPNVTGQHGVYPVQIEMESKQIRDNYDNRIEKTPQVVYSKSYIVLEDPEKLSRETEIFAYKSPLKLLQGNSGNQQNEKCLEQGLCDSSSVQMNMGQKEKNENSIHIEEVDSRLLTELLACIDKSNVQSTLNSRKEFSCSVQLHRVENAGSVVDLSESTYLAAETLLKIRLDNLKLSNVYKFSGLRNSLEWFADMIPGNIDCLEYASEGSREEVDDSLLSPVGFSNIKEPDLYEDPMPTKVYSPCSIDALDFFESMTLMLPESNEEGYFKPIVKYDREGKKKKFCICQS